mgnify:CR=1 FL=1
MKKYILFMMSVWFIQLAIFAQSRIIEVFPEQGKNRKMKSGKLFMIRFMPGKRSWHFKKP